MDADDLVFRHRKKSERIIVAQVFLGHGRESRQVGQVAQIVGMDAAHARPGKHTACAEPAGLSRVRQGADSSGCADGTAYWKGMAVDAAPRLMLQHLALLAKIARLT